MRFFPLFLFCLWMCAVDCLAEQRKLVLVAGKPSHPPRMHEFDAGVQLLANCLKGVPDLDVQVVLNGWPQDEMVFHQADAVVFYMDGGGRHEVVQEQGRRLKLLRPVPQYHGQALLSPKYSRKWTGAILQALTLRCMIAEEPLPTPETYAAFTVRQIHPLVMSIEYVGFDGHFYIVRPPSTVNS